MAPVWNPALRILGVLSAFALQLSKLTGLYLQLGKVGLLGETLNRLDEVLVRGVVAGDDLAEHRDDLERVLAVGPVGVSHHDMSVHFSQRTP